MTTLDNPSISQFLVYKLGKAITARSDTKAKQRSEVNRVRAWFQATMRLTLQLFGFGCLTYAGFEWSTIAGFVVAGISSFALSWLLTSTTPTPKPPQDPMTTRR